MLRLFFLTVAVISCISFSGCDFPEIQRPVATDIGGMALDGGAEPVGQPGNTDTNPPAPTPPPEVRRAAQVGDGVKGHYEEFGRMSIFSHNVGAMYRMKENLTYNIQIPQAMSLYKAMNDRTPRTHEEFMKEIIQANRIPLPELKEGCRYDYNPQTAELEIVFPISMRP